MKSYSSQHFWVLFFLYLVFSQSSFAQDPPIKWGEIPKADLEMKSYLPDTNASALIICDYGESFFNDQLNIVYNRHLRVKILTAKGYEWGTHSVRIYTKDSDQRIKVIEGVTYSLDDKGNVVNTELEKKDVFEEEDGNYTIYKFTLPALKPGCVIEIRYTIESESLWDMKNWVFQHSEPGLRQKYVALDKIRKKV